MILSESVCVCVFQDFGERELQSVSEPLPRLQLSRHPQHLLDLKGSLKVIIFS